jgi:hypothetical protein
MLVGVGQRAARHRPANPEMIELGGTGTQTHLDVAQALAIGQLRESQTKKLVPAGEAIGLPVPAVARHDAAESIMGNPLHELGENHFGRLHPPKIAGRRSCREHPPSSVLPFKTTTYKLTCPRRLDTTDLGYSVIRPTKPNCVGRTLLAHSLRLSREAHLSMCTEIVNLFWARLNVAGFPFISQDADATVCAQSALWMLMRYYSNRYPTYSEILPFQITNLAIRHAVGSRLALLKSLAAPESPNGCGHRPVP